MLFAAPPAWVQEPPQNTVEAFYGIGQADGVNAEAMEKAKIQAFKDLAWKILVTVETRTEENRNTVQQNTFFGSFKDKQEFDQSAQVSSELKNLAGVSVVKNDFDPKLKMTFCMAKLDRAILKECFQRNLTFRIEECRRIRNSFQVQPTSKSDIGRKLQSLRAELDRARNLGLDVSGFEKDYLDLTNPGTYLTDFTFHYTDYKGTDPALLELNNSFKFAVNRIRSNQRGGGGGIYRFVTFSIKDCKISKNRNAYFANVYLKVWTTSPGTANGRLSCRGDLPELTLTYMWKDCEPSLYFGTLGPRIQQDILNYALQL
jgi:hypothetical protein